VTKFADLLMEMKGAVDTAHQASRACLTPEQMSDFNKRYDRWVEQGLQVNAPPDRQKISQKAGADQTESSQKNF
jgi:glutathione peroxidase-family protein